ncbi:hypothetical protein [Bacillus sp. JCM 19041]|uniref:hypothetical protein n=1 Tax=Bacillus sp. JCM 19041 TaxID=1460637 RepID=UPI0012E29BE4
MDNRIQNLITYSQNKWGLGNYQLHHYTINQELTRLNETIYTLCTEWFPPGIETVDEDGSNPEGTAMIEVEIHSRMFRSAIFVGGITHADGMCVKGGLSAVTKWVEEETGLTAGSHFMLLKEQAGSYSFRSCIDGVKTSPSGFIDCEFDQQNRLTSFSKHGPFPEMDKRKKEAFTLTVDRIEAHVNKQIQLYQMPNIEEEKMVAAYLMEELYIRNDDRKTYPYSLVDRPEVWINEVLYWDEATKIDVKRTELQLSREVTEEVALANVSSADAAPLLAEDVRQSIDAVKQLLSTKYSDQSGEFVLTSLFRDLGHIQAIVRPKKRNPMILQPKLIVMIDPVHFEVENYLDTSAMLSMYDSFARTEAVEIPREIAIELLREEIEFSPVYVYDDQERQFVLCGQLDCQKAVLASCGDVVQLNDL